MKTIITISVLLFTNSLFAQHPFLNRKYTKGRFVEKIRKLKHEKEITSSLDSANIIYGLSIPCVEAQMTISDSMYSGSRMSEEVTKTIKEDFYNTNAHHPKGIKNNDVSAIPVTKHNTLLCNNDKNVVASFEKMPFIVNHISQHKSSLPIKKQNRKSMLRLFLEWDNLKHLKITGYTPEAVALSLINYYQSYISPEKGFTCAHTALHQNEVSCSEYGKQAIEKHGIVKGIYLTGKRLNDCGDAYKILNINNQSSKKPDDPWGCNGMTDDCGKQILILLIGAIVVIGIGYLVLYLLAMGIMSIGAWAIICVFGFSIFTVIDIVNYYDEYSDFGSPAELFKKIFVTNLLCALGLFLLPFSLLAG